MAAKVDFNMLCPLKRQQEAHAPSQQSMLVPARPAEEMRSLIDVAMSNTSLQDMPQALFDGEVIRDVVINI